MRIRWLPLHGYLLTIGLFSAGAAGNFLSPISGLSANAFKTVLDIDTVGSVSEASLNNIVLKIPPHFQKHSAVVSFSTTSSPGSLLIREY